MNTTPPTITVTDPGDLLALVPALLGYRPKESLVVVPFGAGRSRGAIRVNLPPAESTAEVARQCLGMVCRLDSVDSILIVAYGEREASVAVAAEFATYAHACGIHLREALYVTGDRWGRIASTDAPVPVPATPEHIAARVTESDQNAGASLPTVDPALTSRIAQFSPSDELDGGALIGLFESALSWDTDRLKPGRAARLIALLNRPAARDIALVQWIRGARGGMEALAAQIAWENGADYPAALARNMMGEGPRPPADRLEAALTVVRHLAAHAPQEATPGPLATAAWLSWALGRSSHAEVYAAHALDTDPEHGLAGIVTALVEAGSLPAWAFA